MIWTKTVVKNSLLAFLRQTHEVYTLLEPIREPMEFWYEKWAAKVFFLEGTLMDWGMQKGKNPISQTQFCPISITQLTFSPTESQSHPYLFVCKFRCQWSKSHWSKSHDQWKYTQIPVSILPLRFAPPVLPLRSCSSSLVLLAVKLENVFGIPEGCVFNLTLIFFLTRFVSLS